MNKLLSLLIALVFALVAVAPASAMPKVAEDESAPVTSVADAPRPKKSRATNSNPVEKKAAKKAARKAAKASHGAKHGRKHGR